MLRWNWGESTYFSRCRLRRKLSSSHSAFFVRFFLGYELSLAMMTLCRVTFRANEARMCWILSSSARMSLGFALHKLTFRGFSQKHPTTGSFDGPSPGNLGLHKARGARIVYFVGIY